MTIILIFEKVAVKPTSGSAHRSAPRPAVLHPQTLLKLVPAAEISAAFGLFGSVCSG
jgi:hypothetical protein